MYSCELFIGIHTRGLSSELVAHFFLRSFARSLLGIREMCFYLFMCSSEFACVYVSVSVSVCMSFGSVQRRFAQHGKSSAFVNIFV